MHPSPRIWKLAVGPTPPPPPPGSCGGLEAPRPPSSSWRPSRVGGVPQSGTRPRGASSRHLQAGEPMRVCSWDPSCRGFLEPLRWAEKAAQGRRSVGDAGTVPKVQLTVLLGTRALCCEPCAHKRRPEVSRGGAELPEVRQREESGLEEKVAFPALGHTRVLCGGLRARPPCSPLRRHWSPGGRAPGTGTVGTRWGGPRAASGAAGGCGVTTGAPPRPTMSSGVGTPAGPGVPLRRVPRR